MPRELIISASRCPCRLDRAAFTRALDLVRREVLVTIAAIVGVGFAPTQNVESGQRASMSASAAVRVLAASPNLGDCRLFQASQSFGGGPALSPRELAVRFTGMLDCSAEAGAGARGTPGMVKPISNRRHPPSHRHSAGVASIASCRRDVPNSRPFECGMVARAAAVPADPATEPDRRSRNSSSVRVWTLFG